jgi:opacity protein-like surface antigen
MKHIAWKVAAVVIAALVALWSTRARAEGESWYGGVAAGRFSPDDASANGPKKELEPGPIGELRIGLRTPMGPSANWGLAAEMALGGFHAEGDMPPVDVTETTMQTLSATWLGTTLKGWHRLGSDRLRVFGGLGVAYYRFDAGLKDPPSTRRDASETDLGAHLVAGVEFDLTSRIGIGLEDRWVSVKASESVFGNGNAAVYAASGNGVMLSAVVRF